MTEKNPHWWARLGKHMPSRDLLSAHPWLRPIAGRLLDQQLWRFQHESVARGVAVGAFWAFLIPVAQIFVAAAHCTLWRANIPAAAAATMVTNPLTIGFWFWLAYRLGALLLGEPAEAVAPMGESAPSWLTEVGLPTLLGMGIFAVGGAATGYIAVKLIWRLRIWLRRRTRRAIL